MTQFDGSRDAATNRTASAERFVRPRLPRRYPLAMASVAGYTPVNRIPSSPGVPPMSDVTCILSAIEQGDSHAAAQLLPLVYDELRKLAAQKLAQEEPGQTLQATALVHEAYLRLVDVEKAQHWNSRGHFFAAAAEAMRRILVENARRKRARKRGGGLVRQDLDAIDLAAPEAPEDLVALDEALNKLAATDKTAAELVQLRSFAGLPEGGTGCPRPLRE
jgi:RNA polymerase sigma factor (TIGR02999 family)